MRVEGAGVARATDPQTRRAGAWLRISDAYRLMRILTWVRC